MDIGFPRINSSQVEQYKGNIVKMIGVVKKLEENQVILATTDHGQVNVTLINRPAFRIEDTVEVTGKVRDDLCLQEHTTYLLPSGMDFNLYETLLEFIPKTEGLFR